MAELVTLDNPIWSSLSTIHAGIARGVDAVRRYPAEYAPFLGIASADAPVADALASLVEPGEVVYLLGVSPRKLPDGIERVAFAPLAQMVRDTPLAVPDGPPVQPLEEARRADVLALAALVYPHYFRRRTMDMGRYFGILHEGRLAAMIGERMGSPAARELSAICTHPDFAGRGYAHRLTAMLVNETLARRRLPFLHVSHENVRAKALYERIGFRHRRDIGFWSLRRR